MKFEEHTRNTRFAKAGPAGARPDRRPAGRLAGWAGALALAALPLAAPATAQEGGTLSVGMSSAANQLVPHPVYQATMPWIHALFDTLVSWDGGPQPMLAEDWQLSEDGRILTLALRDGVSFHDGTPLTAQVVVDNLEWATQPENRVTGNAFLSTGTFSAPDAQTVRMEFPLPAPQVLTVLAVLPIMDLGSDLVSAPNGTGPFRVEAFEPATRIELSRNDAYWNRDAVPDLATLEFPMYNDNASLMAALQSGQVDVWTFPEFQQLTTLEGSGFKLVTQTPPGAFMIRVNTSVEPLDDKRVRQALSYTINREAFSALMTGGKSRPTCSHLPSGSPAYTPEVDESCGQDLDRARELLAEAGYPDGFDVTYVGGSARHPELTRFSPIWQEDLAKVGIDMEVLDLAPSAIRQRTTTGNFELMGDWYPWGVFDPAVFFIGPSFAPNNYSEFKPQDYLDMLDAAQSEADPQARIESYKDINRYLAEQSFIIPIAERPYVYAVGSDVDGLRLDPFGMAYYNDVTVGN